jgi:predicted CoA-binding protein
MSLQANLVDSEEGLATIIRDARTVAVIGIKDGRDDEHAPAFTIPRVLQHRGLRIIPVNPQLEEVLGERAYPNLAAIPEPFDVAQIFRRAEHVPAIADEILALPAARRPRVVWMQTGISHAAAADRLASAGMLVVQNHCMKIFAMRYRDMTYPTI